MLAGDGSFTSQGPQAAVHSQTTGYYAYPHVRLHSSARMETLVCRVCGKRRASINIQLYLSFPWHQLGAIPDFSAMNGSSRLHSWLHLPLNTSSIYFPAIETWLPGSNRKLNQMRRKALKWAFYFKAKWKCNYGTCQLHFMKSLNIFGIPHLTCLFHSVERLRRGDGDTAVWATDCLQCG